MYNGYVDTYFEEKKRLGLIFTEHNIDESRPYRSMMDFKYPITVPVEQPGGPSWWSRELKRYRTAEEQEQYRRELVIQNKDDEEEFKEEERKLYERLVEHFKNAKGGRPRLYQKMAAH